MTLAYIIAILICAQSVLYAASLSVIQDYSGKVPNIFSRGVQFNNDTVFVTQFGSGERFFLTQNAGQSWGELIVKEGEKTYGPYDEMKVAQWFNGTFLLSRLGIFYSKTDSNIWQTCSIRSVVFRGQVGFRVLSDQKNLNRLEKTIDGGAHWKMMARSVGFDRIETFDQISSNVFFALIVVDGARKGYEHRLVKSADSGRSWKEICDTENAPTLQVWATHLFFLNETTGWTASDRDDGLFFTKDGGKSWINLNIPERVVSSIYFKDTNKGRVIGGVSGRVYETENGGKSWRVLNPEEVKSFSFEDYFSSKSFGRWNDFAVYRTILLSQSVTKLFKIVLLDEIGVVRFFRFLPHWHRVL